MTATTTALSRSREACTPALRRAVDRLDPHSRRITAYHLGWTDAAGNEAGGGGGKAVRGALALLSAEAVGAPAQVGLPGAVAVELVHNFSLLHDDVIDGDLQRRHRPTVWAQFGVAGAVLTGDAMLALATEVLLDEGTPEAVRAASLLSVTTRELIHGQFADVAFERRYDVSLAQCLAMAEGKTGALLGTAASIGAVLAGAGEPAVSALARYGRHLGLAFQLVDDLLGIWGDPQTTGKPVLADLRQRKMSLPVTRALSSPGPAARELAAWYATTDDDEQSLRRAADLVEASGARAWAATHVRRQVQCAHQALASQPFADRPSAELADLADHLAGRDA